MLMILELRGISAATWIEICGKVVVVIISVVRGLSASRIPLEMLSELVAREPSSLSSLLLSFGS